ncbi:MAG TPA: potassium channel family protein [Anaerolineae bacterium]|nr:potassium channel family protein [Anaerolineae bacterium]
MLAFLILFVALGRLYRDMVKQPETRALLVLFCLVIFIGIVFYMGVEHWTFINTLYFCVVTLGTVGYGDITPQTEVGRLFTVLYIIVGLGIIGGFFATLGKLIDPQRFLSWRGVTPDFNKEIEALTHEREKLASLIHHAETTRTDRDEQ